MVASSLTKLNNITFLNSPRIRFTTYDFRKMNRRSYYPANQQIATQMTATSSTGIVNSRPETPIMPLGNGSGGLLVPSVRVASEEHDRSANGIQLTDAYGGIEPPDSIPMNGKAVSTTNNNVLNEKTAANA